MKGSMLVLVRLRSRPSLSPYNFRKKELQSHKQDPEIAFRNDRKVKRLSRKKFLPGVTYRSVSLSTQKPTEWVAETTEVYFLRVLEAASPRRGLDNPEASSLGCQVATLFTGIPFECIYPWCLLLCLNFF